MLAFLPQRIVLLAVPKTGTTALANHLNTRAALVLRQPLKHMTLERFRQQVLPLVARGAEDRVETVAVVREPVDWLGSWYRYRTRPELAGHPNSTAGLSFDAFVEAYLDDAPPAFAAVGSQSPYVFDAGGERGVTHLFRYDRLGELVAFLEARLRTEIRLPQANVSPKMPIRLSPRVEARLRELRALDFRAWEAAGGG